MARRNEGQKAQNTDPTHDPVVEIGIDEALNQFQVGQVVALVSKRSDSAPPFDIFGINEDVFVQRTSLRDDAAPDHEVCSANPVDLHPAW